MEDIWERTKDYAELLSRWLSSTNASNGEMLSLLVFACLTFCVMLYITSPRHQERVVSKQEIRRKRKEREEKVQDYLTGALEQAVKDLTLTREEANREYKRLRDAGYKEIGPEPSFGRPWYYGPKMPENLKVAKMAALTRLHNMGVNVEEKLSKLNRRRKARKIDKLVSSFKKPKSA